MGTKFSSESTNVWWQCWNHLCIGPGTGERACLRRYALLHRVYQHVKAQSHLLWKLLSGRAITLIAQRSPGLQEDRRSLLLRHHCFLLEASLARQLGEQRRPARVPAGLLPHPLVLQVQRGHQRCRMCGRCVWFRRP